MKIPRVGIGVLIFKDKQLLLGKRLNSHGSHTYGPPGGHLEFGESLEGCAIREVAEETGLELSSPVFAALTNDVFSEEDKHYVSLFMQASFPAGQSVVVKEPDKIMGWEWFKFDALPENLFLPLQNLLRMKGEDYLLSLAGA